MGKAIYSLFFIFFFTACKKGMVFDDTQLSGKIIQATKSSQKIQVCHFDGQSGTSQTILIDISALSAHLAHGDITGNCADVTTTICNQNWMVRNLDVSTYRNGDTIPQVTDPAEWAQLNTGAWCYYKNNPSNESTYGKLYNWYAVNDPRGLAPKGWHIPSASEWYVLIKCIDPNADTSHVFSPFGWLIDNMSPSSIAGGAMKETGTLYWHIPNQGASNSTHFTGLANGYRYDSGLFNFISYYGYWWSTTYTKDIIGSQHAWHLNLQYNDAVSFVGFGELRAGLSVRCIKDYHQKEKDVLK
ncbi:MAG: fibrobacter succinogenes major paralogous domain-containing protein [Sphingobacteriales bacterium]|nr:fibrobacter succinogenes major paralogous domain-containing protein [Sphingobacteriales bacterium]MBI3719151.1 fibrobacter succinogenes major paralogous domain-containing protein [Sphingobacteriales bacterium]